MSFEISTTGQFSAAHQLELYDGSREQVHGHNWRVRVTVAGQELDRIGVVMDFHALSRRLKAIVAPWQDRNLNDMPAFTQTNPSAENIALVIARALRLPEGVSLCSVEVWETSEDRAVYRP